MGLIARVGAAGSCQELVCPPPHSSQQGYVRRAPWQGTGAGGEDTSLRALGAGGAGQANAEVGQALLELPSWMWREASQSAPIPLYPGESRLGGV